MPKLESKIEFINLAMPSLTNTDQQTTSANTTDRMSIIPNRKGQVDRIAFTYQIQSAHIKKVIAYMLDNYGDVGSCLGFTAQAIAEVGDKRLYKDINFSEFDYDTVLKDLQRTGSNVPSTPVPGHPDRIPASTVFMIKLDILSADEAILDRFNGTSGDHIHSLLIIVDSEIAEYQILMASNGSFTLNEFYNGILLNECNGKKIKTGSVGANDIKTFKDYHNNVIIPYAGTISNVPNNNEGFLITKLKKLASTNTSKVKLDEEVQEKLNILCGFDNFNKDYNPGARKTHGCFEHNVKGMGTAYSVLRCDVATVRQTILVN
jgi:hypothetical protein